MPDRIEVNDALMERTKTSLKGRYDTVAAVYSSTTSSQDLTALEVKVGKPEFLPAKHLHDAVFNTGTGIYNRLQSGRTMMEDLYAGLVNFKANNADVEALNDATAADFLEYFTLGGPPPAAQ